jgi:uncharacterized protein YutE (UPF0331/DUF86 family)
VKPQQVASLRNQVAHGGDEIDGAKLQRAFDECFDLARRLALHEIGATSS